MINDIFVYDNSTNKINLNTPEILLVKEFNALLNPERNKCKEDPKGVLGLRAFREFTYIWLAICWKSVYADYSEQERHQEALKDSGLLGDEIITNGKTGVSYGSSSGSLDAILDFYSMCVENKVKNLNSGSYINCKICSKIFGSLSKFIDSLLIVLFILIKAL